MAEYRRVGIFFFMPETRDRFRRRLYRKWQKVGEERAMLMGSILATPELKAELNRRLRPEPTPQTSAPVAKARQQDRECRQ